MKKNSLAIFLVTLLVGCATPYDTQKSGWNAGMGFTTTQINSDIWQIDFTGNDFTDRDTTKRFVLRKAAEIATRDGYPYFRIIDGQTDKDITGVSSNSTWAANSLNSQTYATSKTTTNMTVQMLKTKDGQAGMIFDAAFLLSSISIK